MEDKGWNILRLTVLVLLISLSSLYSEAIADAGSGPWTIRSDIVWVAADSDWDPVDNMFGISFDVLYEVGARFRGGGEVQWVTGDDGLAKGDWITLFAVGEYSFVDRTVENYDVYFKVGLGFIFADRTVGPASGDDTSFAFRPAIGGDLFFTEYLALNMQVGYLWSQTTHIGSDFDTAGFEGKVGLTVAF